MTAKNDARLNMIAAVITLYNLTKAKFDVIPRIKFLFNELIIPKYAAIQLVLNGARQSTRDTTEMKNKEKEELAAAIFDIQKPLQSYAASIGDLVLKRLVGRTLRTLKRLKLDKVEDTCKAIIDKATSLQTELESYGLTQARITLAKDKLAAWKTWYTATAIKKGEIASSNTNVDKQIKVIMDILKEQLDPLVGVIPNDVETQQKYASARVITSPGRTVTQLQLPVMTRNGDGSLHPVCGATLNLRMTYTDKKKVTHHIVEHTGKTDIDGLATFKPLRQGYYDIEVLKAGYQPFTLLQIRVKKGQIGRIEVELLPEA